MHCKQHTHATLSAKRSTQRGIGLSLITISVSHQFSKTIRLTFAHSNILLFTCHTLDHLLHDVVAILCIRDRPRPVAYAQYRHIDAAARLFTTGSIDLRLQACAMCMLYHHVTTMVNILTMVIIKTVAVIFPPRNRARVIATEFPLLKVEESYQLRKSV